MKKVVFFIFLLTFSSTVGQTIVDENLFISSEETEHFWEGKGFDESNDFTQNFPGQNQRWRHPITGELYPYDGQPHGNAYLSGPCPHCGHCQHYFVDGEWAWCKYCNHDCRYDPPSESTPVGKGLIVILLGVIFFAGLGKHHNKKEI